MDEETAARMAMMQALASLTDEARRRVLAWVMLEYPPRPTPAEVEALRTSKARSQLFDAFWEAYPPRDGRRTGKIIAARAYRRANPTADPTRHAQIMEGVARDTRSRQWQESRGRFVPLAATWLNQRRWEDEEVSAPDGRGRVQAWLDAHCRHTPCCARARDCDLKTALGEARFAELHQP